MSNFSTTVCRLFRFTKSPNFIFLGTEVKLKESAEEIMTFYARMLDHDYTSKEVFNTNFMTDWRKSMTQAERELIKDIRKCDFTQVANYFKEQTEQRKAMSKEEKKKLKDENEKIRKEYGYCMWDKHRQPVGNYKIEPPGLFRGRGEHPKMGCVKKRIRPEDIIINIGREAQKPKPPEGHHWKEVRHDNKVSWLVMWTENIRGNNKYIMLNASSRVKVCCLFGFSMLIGDFYRVNVIGKNMKKLENFIDLLIQYGRIIKLIGKVKKCVYVNVLLHFILLIK
jgi:DNA topoisomerase-1